MKAENWMKWDIDSLEGKRAKWYLLGFDNKDAALGTFLRLVTLLYQKDDHWIAMDDMFYETYCHDACVQKDYLFSAIARLISAKLFITRQIDGLEYFASQRVLDECERRENLSKVRSVAGTQGARITNNSRQLLGKSRQSPAKHRDKIREDKNNIINPHSSSGEIFFQNNKIGKVDFEELQMPEKLRTEQAAAALMEWIIYKKEIKQGYSGAKAVNKLLEFWNQFGADVFIQQINLSIRNRYAGIFEPNKIKKSEEPKSNFIPRVVKKSEEPKRIRTEEEKQYHRKLLLEKFPKLAGRI